MRFVRLIKGIILIAWIVTLLSLAVYAGSGKASIAQLLNLFTNLSSSWQREVKQEIISKKELLLGDSDKKEKIEEQNNPNIALKDYIASSNYTDPIPIESILDGMFVKISWENIGKTYKLSKADYVDLFINIENEIKSISNNASIELEKYRIRVSNIINAFTKLPQPSNSSEPEGPLDTQEKFNKISQLRKEIETIAAENSEGIDIPHEVKVWITRNRSLGDVRKDRDKLLNTFLLLIVIGTFGSVIFLVRDFIDIDTEASTTFSSYLLKPILGMFLAIAVFIIDILAHAAVSSGSILAVRHETLYVLALAAGLLSEQTSAVVSSRAQMALKNFQESE